MKIKILVTLTAIAVLTENVYGRTENLLQGWDGTGCEIQNPKPSDFGWTTSGSSTFYEENHNGGIRFTTTYDKDYDYKLSNGTSYTYSADSDPSSKIFWIRYNTSGESFTYTTNTYKLQAGHIYKYSALVGWHANNNAPTVTTKIKAGDKELATVSSKSISVKKTLYPIETTFKVSDDVDANSFSVSFTCNRTGDCMIALSALSIVEVVGKEKLKYLIDNFVKVPTTNIGDGAFLYPEQAIININNTLQAAKDVLEDENATIDQVNEQITNVSNLTIPALNGPAANTRYSITNVSISYGYADKAMTLTNDRTNAGGYNVYYSAEPNSNYGQAFEFTPVPDKNDTYYLSQTDKDGETRYLCLGTKYGGDKYQIRTTTTKNDAAEFCVIPMDPKDDKENNWKIINVEANVPLGANGNNDAGVYTANGNYRMVIATAEQAKATLKIVTGVKYGTFIAPFKADKPANVTLYSVEEVDGSTLTLKEADEIAANTPYIVYADVEVTEILQGYGTATKDTYEADNLVGTLPGGKMPLDTDCYLLQKNNEVVGFYQCQNVEYTLGANRAYLKYGTPAGVKAFFFGEENQTTAITTLSELMNGKAEIYDLNGRKLRKLEKGINIVNGKKVIIK